MSERSTSFITGADEPPVSKQEARAELERLLADPGFRSTDRNRRFLRYVSEKLLEGNAKQIKAYAIAVDVFGRPADFDPGLDPIVRIEATRLRASLVHYYDGKGSDHSVRIDLPKGGYQPLFIRRVAELADTHQLSFSEKPRLLISIADSPPLQGDAQVLREELLSTLSPFQTVMLMTAEGTRKASVSPCSSLSPQASLLDLRLNYRALGQDGLLCWQLVDCSSGEVVASARDLGLLERCGDGCPLLARLANRIVGRQGVINCRELQRELIRPTLGNGCLLRAFHGLRTGDLGAQAQAREALEASIRERPSDPELQAALALLLAASPTSAGTVLQRALQLAEGATALAPYSATSAWARATVLGALHQMEAAELAARQAIRLNPNDRELLAAIGKLLCLSDNWETGAPLLERALLLDQVAHLPSALALAAWRAGNLDEARQQLGANLMDSASVTA